MKISALFLLLGAFLLGPLASSYPAQAALPPQGIYEQCPAADVRCDFRLGVIAAAGFSTVLNYRAWEGTPDEVERYADAARRAGVGLIWPLNHRAWRGRQPLAGVYHDFARGCLCAGPALFARMIDLAAAHPATAAFYTADELPAGEAPAVAALRSRVRARAPHHQQLIVALETRPRQPGHDLLPFMRLAEWLGSVYYPIGSSHDPTDTGRVALATAVVARMGNAQPAMVLQAFSWTRYARSGVSSRRLPSFDEMRTMRDQALLVGRPNLVLWYSFQDVVAAPDPARHWRALVSAAFAPPPADPPAPSPAPVSPPPSDTEARRASRSQGAPSRLSIAPLARGNRLRVIVQTSRRARGHLTLTLTSRHGRLRLAGDLRAGRNTLVIRRAIRPGSVRITARLRGRDGTPSEFASLIAAPRDPGLRVTRGPISAAGQTRISGTARPCPGSSVRVLVHAAGESGWHSAPVRGGRWHATVPVPRAAWVTVLHPGAPACGLAGKSLSHAANGRQLLIRQERSAQVRSRSQAREAAGVAQIWPLRS